MIFRKAFSLIELLVVIAIIALVISIIIPSMFEARKSARTVVCSSNLSQFGVATHTYAADFQDRIFAYTWKPGLLPSKYRDLSSASTPMSASMCQAVDIIRRRADRPDMLRLDLWIPNIYYSHLPLQDYLAQELPHRMAACPEDWRRIAWQVQPKSRFDLGFHLPDQPRPHPHNRRWPYSASYQLVPAAYDRTQNPTSSLRQARVHNRYVVPTGAKFGDRLLTEVVFPSTKVQMFDMFSRHSGRTDAYYGNVRTKQPLLLFDTSVQIKRTGDSNEGWDPWKPEDPDPTWIEYYPPQYEPPRTGPDPEVVAGHYQWTRDSLRGSDF